MLDLHIHSRYSDGTLTPSEIVDAALEKKLLAFSITDHDNVGGLKEAMDYSEDNNILFIPGVELSTKYKEYDVHILGYFVDYTDDNLIKKLDTLRKNRVTRTTAILNKMKNDGFKISIEEVSEIAGVGSIGRVHIAKALLQKRYANSIPEAFKRFLAKNAPYYVTKEVLEMNDAISMLKSSGALTVLAHPGLDNAVGVLDDMTDFGLDGIEIYHPQNSNSVMNYLKKFVKDHDMIFTGGSDNHGMNGKHGCPIGGMFMPDAIVNDLMYLYSNNLNSTISDS